jgi:hypothetical protein
MMKMSGRFRHTSTHAPATTAIGLMRESRASARPRPATSASTIAMTAISRLIAKPSRMNRTLFPLTSHCQLAGSKR